MKRTVAFVALGAAAAAMTVGSTGAYFTSQVAAAGNSASTGTLSQLVGATAVKSGATVGQSTTLTWPDAKTLPWAASNPSAEVTYTVQQSTVNDFSAAAQPKTVYQGTSTSPITDSAGSAPVAARQVSQVKASERQDGMWGIIGGQVYLWGRIYKADAGDSIYVGTPTATPMAITGIAEEVKQLAPGRDHACALTVTGKVYCMGFNGYGQLGRNSLASDVNATAIVDVNNVFTGQVITSISSNEYYTCALTSTGTIGCWGINTYGQLGNPAVTAAYSTVPVKVAKNLAGDTHDVFAEFKPASIGLSAFTACASKGSNTDANGTVTRPDHNQTVVCWGRNNWSQLGSAVPISDTAANRTPVYIQDPYNVVTGNLTISGGHAVLCLLTEATTVTNVACWGGGGRGLLGTGTDANYGVPTPILGGGLNYTTLDVGELHACAANADGYTCWGQNEDGQLGRGTLNARYSGGAQSADGFPLLAPGASIKLPGMAAGDVINSIGTSWASTCASTVRGMLACWGNDYQGEAAQGSYGTQRPTPVLAKFNGSPLDYATGSLHCYDGALLLADNTCSLVPNRTYYYRLGYSVAGAEQWRSQTVVLTR